MRCDVQQNACGKFITLEGGEGCGKSTQLQMLKDFLDARGVSYHVTREPGGTPLAEDIRTLLVQGKANKMDALTEYLLFSAARRDHLEKVIKPKLCQGIWVICDRFYDSSLVYQGMTQGVDIDFMNRVYQEIAGAHYNEYPKSNRLEAEIEIEEEPEQIGALHLLSAHLEILQNIEQKRENIIKASRHSSECDYFFAPDLTFFFDLDPKLGLKRSLDAGKGDESRFEEKGLAFHEKVRNYFLELCHKNPKRMIPIDASRSREEVAQAVQSHIKKLLDVQTC